MSEHAHTWSVLARIADGDSVDTYSGCGCSAVLHVYTYEPGNIRHENVFAGGSWTDGYAHGLARGLRGTT